MSLKILVVDDDAGLVALFEEILKDEGFSVESYTNPIKGYERARTGSFDAITLDMNMPQMGGLDFLRQAQSEKQQEIYRILLEITSRVLPEKEALCANADILYYWDGVQARARLATRFAGKWIGVPNRICGVGVSYIGSA